MNCDKCGGVVNPLTPEQVETLLSAPGIAGHGRDLARQGAWRHCPTCRVLTLCWTADTGAAA